ncbi:hypothetical protein Tco_0296339 [Tanacetum coccineum]
MLIYEVTLSDPYSAATHFKGVTVGIVTVEEVKVKSQKTLEGGGSMMACAVEEVFEFKEVPEKQKGFIDRYQATCAMITYLEEGLEVGSIQRIQGIGYSVLEFLGVETTFDIFQNIYILYLEYSILSFSIYDVLSLFPLWSLVSAGTDTPYLP